MLLRRDGVQQFAWYTLPRKRWKSRCRCDQHSWRRSGLRWLKPFQRSEARSRSR